MYNPLCNDCMEIAYFLGRSISLVISLRFYTTQVKRIIAVKPLQTLFEDNVHKPTGQWGSGRAEGGRGLTSCCNHPLAALFPLADSPIAPGRTRPTATPAVTAPASFTGESLSGVDWVGGDGLLGFRRRDRRQMWIVVTSS